jgi:hypothetical protein
VNFLFDALRKFITRRRPDRITRTIKEEPPLIFGANLLKTAPFCSISVVRGSFEYDTLSLFWLIDSTCGTQRKWNFQAKLVVKDPEACGLSNPDVATKHLARTE